MIVDDAQLDLDACGRGRRDVGRPQRLESVIGVLGTANFPRLRIGVGAATRGAIWPTTCWRDSIRPSGRALTKRSAGRPTPPRLFVTEGIVAGDEQVQPEGRQDDGQ